MSDIKKAFSTGEAVKVLKKYCEKNTYPSDIITVAFKGDIGIITKIELDTLYLDYNQWVKIKLIDSSKIRNRTEYFVPHEFVSKTSLSKVNAKRL